MLCILRTDDNLFTGSLKDSIKGWIIATDLDDARRQAQGALDHELAAALYRMTFAPPPGKHVFGPYLILVS